MKPIILLSGPVGAGKTTVARELIASSPGPVVYMEGDTFWSFIVRQSEWLPPHKNFKMIMTAMTAAALPCALYGYETIVDFSIPPWFLETADKITGKKEVPLDYVVLLPDEAVCAARAAARTEGTITDYTRYRELYQDFKAAGRRHILSDNDSDATVLAGKIREGLKEGKFRLL